MNSEEKTIDGAITKFEDGDKLVLTRASIKALDLVDCDNNNDNDNDCDNKYSLVDKTPTTLDLNFSDGVQLKTSEEFAVFGVVTPINAGTTLDPYNYMYYIVDNRIAQIHYLITRNMDKKTIADTTRNVTLEREYYKAVPAVWFPSIYEFEHEFKLVNVEPGTYTVELFALDKKGAEVSGTTETFIVEYR